MPELPEVEIVKRGLQPVMTGRAFAAVELARADLRFPLPERFAERLAGAAVERVERRAKYLLVRLDFGDILIIHLGMTGRLSITAPSGLSPQRLLGDYVYGGSASHTHDHVTFRMSDGTTVTYNDPRRFGYMLLVPAGDLAHHPLFSRLGVEPLDAALDAGHLAHLARGRRSDLKSFLSDQRMIAGLGNIYVSEALHRAGLSPRRAAGSLALASGAPSERARRLVPEIKAVLSEAIAGGGSTLRDYRQTDGTRGAFQRSFAVYDRAGEPCPRPGCGGTVSRIVQAGRSTFYCPTCQR
ncbi:MAG: bifunctional DNA-formamidopyrimidine glycosylase/DNA-(apurinic or apyrimidinic site) lyase [Hyphomicrobium sp.]